MRSSDVKTFSDGDGHTTVRQAGAAHAERKIGPIARFSARNTDISFESWRYLEMSWIWIWTDCKHLKRLLKAATPMTLRTGSFQAMLLVQG